MYIILNIFFQIILNIFFRLTMDAQSLATALVSGGRSDPEKLRLIRSVFPPKRTHLSSADLTFVLGRLMEHHGLEKLIVKLANISRDKDFVLGQLSSTNILIPGDPFPVALHAGDWVERTFSNARFAQNEPLDST